VAIDVVDICRFADGKLFEHWGVPDRFALLHQLDDEAKITLTRGGRDNLIRGVEWRPQTACGQISFAFARSLIRWLAP
jgi:hypothetical protein